MRGDVLPADRAEGLRLLTRGCNLGLREDCFEVGQALAARGEAAQALRYLRASCAWGEVKGCAALGVQLLIPPLDAERRDEALAVLRFACTKSDSESCKQVAAVEKQ
jgi:TPR repeat protein